MPTSWTPNTYRALAQEARAEAERSGRPDPDLANAVRQLAQVVEALVDQCDALRLHKADAS